MSTRTSRSALRRTRGPAALVTAVFTATALSACGGDESKEATSAGSKTSALASGSSKNAAKATFPLTFTNADGSTTEIKSQPKNIASTSVVLTGDLLAIDAPVKGSAASMPNVPGMDGNGFFSQWSDVAKAKGVKPLYTKSELNLESVTAAKPDLIVVAESGGDSQKDKINQLKAIAPVITVNYLTQNWQGVAKQLGEATGHAADAEKIIADYDMKIADYKTSMKPPTDEVQSIVFNPQQGSAFANQNSTYDAVYKALGIKLAPVDASLAEKDGEGGGARKDVTFMSAENSIKSLKSKTLLLLDADEKTVEQFKSTKGYSSSPAAGKDGKIVPLGHESFKVDYYSALIMAKHLADAFKS